jgi:hypothetical protein
MKWPLARPAASIPAACRRRLRCRIHFQRKAERSAPVAMSGYTATSLRRAYCPVAEVDRTLTGCGESDASDHELR